MNEPTAEVVAMAEPEIAAKNMQVIVVTMLRPPVIKPVKVSKKFRIRLAMPPPLIRLPASIKNGTAIRGNESAAGDGLLRDHQQRNVAVAADKNGDQVSIPMA